MTPSPEPAPLRRHLYVLLILVAGCMALGRILNAELVYEPSLYRKAGEPPSAGRPWPPDRPEPMPTFSSNDRSRWATVRALVDNGTYVIGHRDPSKATAKNKYGDDGIVFEDGWQTVDKVMNPETRDFYSSKPPLLPTLMAGEYWLLKHAFGWSITTHRWAVVRTIVLTFNWLPWLLYLWLLSRLVERFGATDWGRLYVFATGCFGTLMTPFLISISNHTVATCSALLALYFAAQIFLSESPRAWWFALAGFFAAFTATDELPAASFTAALGLLMLWRFPRQTLLFFAPAAAVPVAAFLLTNHLAISDWKPAYSKFGTDWYQYEGSHWGKDPDPVKPGIDFARLKEDRLTYAFHVLVGHHGLFSLTPIFLLAVIGMLWGIARLWAGLAGLTLVLTVIVVGFYLIKSDNYGGWTAGPRWLMWLTPFWLLAMLPVVDRLGKSRGGRALAYLLLAVSVMSMSYPAWNPWRHPWIYRFMDENGWIPY
ncbi:MAG: hypothetical protein HYS12_18310 [Planctomycetes bacterium]|nr:hypothetical protein [Planctomycetota bacterium]